MTPVSGACVASCVCAFVPVCSPYNAKTTERAHTTGVELEAFNTLMPTVATMATAIKHPVLDRVKPSFAIFDVRAL